MEYKGKQISGRDIATVELLEEIKAYFSEDGAALNALALGGVNATNYALKADVDKSIAGLESSATKVSFAQTLTEGTKIGSITIDDTTTNIYAPSLTSNLIINALGYQPISQTWINNQGFAKSTDVEAVEAMFDSYYTSGEIDTMLSTFSDNVESAYVSKNHLGTVLLGYATTTDVDDKLKGYVPSTGGTFNALAIGYFGEIGTYKLYVNGRTYIAGSLKIGDATLSWDSTNKALKVDKPMYSTGTIASGGVLAAASQLTTLEARVKALEDKVNELI